MLTPDGYTLVMVATTPDKPRYAEFYRIDAVLALQHAPGPLPDHPGLALPTVAECGQQMAWYLDDLRPEQVTRLNRWTAAGWVIAFRWNAGGTARLDRREAKRYLTEEEIFWLAQYAETSILWGEQRRKAANNAILADLSAADEERAATGAKRGRASKKQRKQAAKLRRRNIAKTEV